MPFSVGRTNAAAAHADKVIKLQEALPQSEGLTYNRELLTWSFMNSEGLACTERAVTKQRIRADLIVLMRLLS